MKLLTERVKTHQGLDHEPFSSARPTPERPWRRMRFAALLASTGIVRVGSGCLNAISDEVGCAPCFSSACSNMLTRSWPFLKRDASMKRVYLIQSGHRRPPKNLENLHKSSRRVSATYALQAKDAPLLH